VSLIQAVLGAGGLAGFAAMHLAAQAIAYELGHWIGRRRAAGRPVQDEIEAVGFVMGGLLTLLGFTLALTISFAQTRFEEQRLATLTEANAIGTAWLRAQALGHPRGAEIARELENYILLRRDYIMAPPDPVELRRLIDATSAAQTRLWSQLTAITAERTDPVAATLVTSLNEVFDAATADRFAFVTRLPRELASLLLALSVLTIAIVGYQFGLRGPPRRLMAFLLFATWTGALTLVADLSAPRIGDRRANPAVYDWTAQGFAGGIPPAPPLR
jgi:hypothetical protein